MITVKDIYDLIDGAAPYSTQFEWDNSGLAVGAWDDEVRRVLLSLDCTNNAVELAKDRGCDMILTHHPLLFRPARSVEKGTPLYAAVRNGISVLSAHTNLDMAEGGINDRLAQALSLENVRVLPMEGKPMLRIGELKEAMRCDEFAEFVADRLFAHVGYTPYNVGKIKTVAVCGGSGGEYAKDVRAAGADALVTGEAKHNQLYEAADCGLCLAEAGHYETEECFLDIRQRLLTGKFGDDLSILLYRQPTLDFVEPKLDYGD